MKVYPVRVALGKKKNYAESMRTSNPALGEKTFTGYSITSDETMTIQGTVNKSFILIALVVLAALYSWSAAFPAGWNAEMGISLPGWYFPAIIGNFIVAIAIIFKKNWAPALAPVYAVLEGLALGALSVIFEMRYPGIVMQAVLGTMGTFLGLLIAYKTGIIKATENFKLGVMAATFGIAFVYLIDLAIGFFTKGPSPMMSTTPLGIGISVFVVVIAALNLVLDFDFIEQGAKSGAPKFMEWYAAFGLLVTLVWLYLEILRLLGKTRK